MANLIISYAFRRFRLSGILLNDLSWRRSIPTLTYMQLNLNGFHSTSVYEKRRKTAEERKSQRIIEYSPKAKSKNVVDIWKNMTVQDIANVTEKDIDHVFEAMLYINNTSYYSESDSIITDQNIVKEILKKLGFKYKIVSPPDNVLNTYEQKHKDAVRQPTPDLKLMVKRSPVVTIMGHVDHGKTTLLDSLRNTSVVEQEFGGITQHIGAFSVTLKSGEKITFLDTPGHAAFSAMRARGATVTDLVILVVAADDGVMEQTIESIQMAKEASVPIIVAINKIDKLEADIERTKKMLMQHGIQVEDVGGEVQCIPISALKLINLDVLTEAIVLQSEMLNLKCDVQGLVEGVVIESKTDPKRGKLSTAIVQRGTLRKGTILVAGNAWAKVRAMFDHDGCTVNEALPSTPVEILGWRELPSAGDEILEVQNERRAHEVMKFRELKKLEEKQQFDANIIEAKIAEHTHTYREQLEYKRKIGRMRLKPTGPREKEIKIKMTSPHINVIIKGDTDGSVEAILDILETYDCESQCKLDLVHYGVGNITENDVELAETFDATIYGFNIECPDRVMELIKSTKIQLKHHNVIYKLVNDLKEEISSQLPPNEVEEIIGEANVLQQFVITEGKKKVFVAGCRCSKGILKKSGLYKVVRGIEVIHTGTLHSMRHLKSEIDSIKKDVECGLQFHDKNIEFKQGDTIICYQLNKMPQKTDWNPGF